MLFSYFCNIHGLFFFACANNVFCQHFTSFFFNYRGEYMYMEGKGITSLNTLSGKVLKIVFKFLLIVLKSRKKINK